MALLKMENESVVVPICKCKLYLAQKLKLRTAIRIHME